MTEGEALIQWAQLRRKPKGCVAAIAWFCKRVKGYKPKRINRYTKRGELYQHVVAYNGVAVVDLAHEFDLPKDYDPKVDGKLD